MPKPAVGRIVHAFVDPALNNGSGIAPAIITRVWNDEMVNVRVLVDGNSVPLWLTSVTLCANRESAGDVQSHTISSTGSRMPAAVFWPPIV